MCLISTVYCQTYHKQNIETEEGISFGKVKTKSNDQYVVIGVKLNPAIIHTNPPPCFLKFCSKMRQADIQID